MKDGRQAGRTGWVWRKAGRLEKGKQEDKEEGEEEDEEEVEIDIEEEEEEIQC